MRWNLRMKAAEQGIWKSTEMRRRLAEAGMEISAGKMSALWTGTPTSIRLDDLDVLCLVLGCAPSDLLLPEPGKAAARRREPAEEPPAATADGGGGHSGGQSRGHGGGQSGGQGGQVPPVRPRLGRHRSVPPA